MSSRQNIFIDCGTDNQTIIRITDNCNNMVDFTGFTGNSDIRQSYASVNVTASFNVSFNLISGSIILSMNSATSGNIKYGRYVYDVKTTASNGMVSRILEGMVTFLPQVTSSLVQPANTEITITANNLLPYNVNSTSNTATY